ncbi:uncharacterized protein EAF01_000554 [Botrytis porri]|uniref:uncharacterized protein n=1 Tax=Botrytis porri TaxID=87229 RepID=UPI001902BD23|nr:uncharacterized protein EAF01_000554 [Botrytis porri]KAF7914148.1 hypothetical protein EAF01_000554 [Botrytis porri]
MEADYEELDEHPIMKREGMRLVMRTVENSFALRRALLQSHNSPNGERTFDHAISPTSFCNSMTASKLNNKKLSVGLTVDKHPAMSSIAMPNWSSDSSKRLI